MRATEEYGIRMRRALDYFFGAKELGLSREQMCSELVRLNDDEDLHRRLYDESVEVGKGMQVAEGFEAVVDIVKRLKQGKENAD